MFCTACGVKNPADSNFCKQCGKPVERAVKIAESDYIHAMPEDEQALALLESALQHRARGDFNGAIGLCEEALRLQPDNAAAHSLIAQTALQQGDKLRAIREYEMALALNPNNVADKIKLDELRSGKIGARRAPSAPPSEGAALNPLLVVAACAGLLAVGWVMSDQWRKTQGKGGSPALQQSAGLLQNPAPASQPQQIANGGVSNTASGTPQASPQSLGSPPAAQPQDDGMVRISAPPFYPPVVLNANAAAQTASTGGAGRVSRGGNGGLPPFNPQNAALEEIYSPKPGTRVHLDAGAEKEPDKDPKYIVKIDMKAQPSPGSVVVNPGSPSATAPDPVAGDTRQAIEAANNYVQRNDFDGAIRALKAAQKNPGSQAGKIHQDLAYCYQQKGNKATAKTHYEQAIAEYEAQIKQGSQKELAESGIRVCRRGIKQCD